MGSRSITLGAIAPPWSFKNPRSEITWPDGRRPALYRCVFSSFLISELYGVNTRLLSALGVGLLDIHHTWVKESFNLTLFTFTHAAGPGSRAGLWQMICWQRCRSAAFLKVRSASRGRVDITGSDFTQALPISRTIEPSSARSSTRRGAREAS